MSSDSFIILDMPNLINLAIGKHSLNINLLRAILHLIVSQMNLKSLKIQLPIDEDLQISQSDVNKMKPTPEDLFTIYNVFEPPKGEFNPKKCTLKPIIERSVEINKLIVLKDDQYLPPDLTLNNPPQESEMQFIGMVGIDEINLQIIDMKSWTARLDRIENMNRNIKDSDLSMVDSKVSNLKINMKKKDHERPLSTRQTKIQECLVDLDQMIVKHDFIISESGKDINQLKKEILNIKSKPDPEELKELEAKILKFLEVEKLQNNTQLNAASEKICTLEKSIQHIKVQITQVNKFTEISRYQFKKIFLSLAQMNAAFKNEEVFLQAVFADNKELNNRVDTLNEAIELVKCTKSDKISVEDEFKKKASKEDIEHLVDMDYFQHVKRDISRGLIDALEKILESDVGWHKSIEDIYYRLENSKLDRNEFAANCLITSSKLTTLKEKIRQISMFRISSESAATQQKYPKDCTCISCNAQTSMQPKLTYPLIPKPKEMPKKNQKKGVQFSKLQVVPKVSKVDLAEPKMVTRYCGGENTMTTASERLSKKGNFLEDNNGAIPNSYISVEYEQGTDGKMYRVDKQKCDCDAENNK